MLSMQNGIKQQPNMQPNMVQPPHTSQTRAPFFFCIRVLICWWQSGQVHCVEKSTLIASGLLSPTGCTLIGCWCISWALLSMYQTKVRYQKFKLTARFSFVMIYAWLERASQVESEKLKNSTDLFYYRNLNFLENFEYISPFWFVGVLTILSLFYVKNWVWKCFFRFIHMLDDSK